MWFGTQSGVYMLSPAQERWEALCSEDRAVLDHAFSDAMQNPHRVGDYKLDFFKLLQKGPVVWRHTFRFGDANFILLVVGRQEFVYDLWLEGDIALAAE